VIFKLFEDLVALLFALYGAGGVVAMKHRGQVMLMLSSSLLYLPIRNYTGI